MKRLLLASLATGALAFAAPAMAQTAPPVPANPPIEQPETTSQTTQDEQLNAVPAAPPAGEMAEAAEAADAAQSDLAQTPSAAPAPDAQLAATPEPSPADVAPTAQASSAQAVCQPRVTSVHFGQRGTALTRENRNAIEHAVDAASVCNLEQVTITDSAEGRTSDRRAETVRATLMERGVPEERIIVAEDANSEGAATGQLNVHMTFAGVATSQTPVANLEGAQEPSGG